MQLNSYNNGLKLSAQSIFWTIVQHNKHSEHDDVAMLSVQSKMLNRSISALKWDTLILQIRFQQYKIYVFHPTEGKLWYAEDLDPGRFQCDLRYHAPWSKKRTKV